MWGGTPHHVVWCEVELHAIYGVMWGGTPHHVVWCEVELHTMWCDVRWNSTPCGMMWGGTPRHKLYGVMWGWTPHHVVWCEVELHTMWCEVRWNSTPGGVMRGGTPHHVVWCEVEPHTMWCNVRCNSRNSSLCLWRSSGRGKNPVANCASQLVFGRRGPDISTGHVLHQLPPPPLVRNVPYSHRPRVHDRELPVASAAMRTTLLFACCYWTHNYINIEWLLNSSIILNMNSSSLFIAYLLII